MNYKIILASAISDITNLKQDYIERLIEVPPKKELGDFSFPCFKIIDKLKKNPNEIAKEIKSQFKNDIFEKTEIYGSYLNFYLNKSENIRYVIGEILSKNYNYGMSKYNKSKKIYIEDLDGILKCQPIEDNRFSRVISKSLYKILKSQGYDIVTINSLDCGNNHIYKEINLNKIYKVIDKNKIKYKNYTKIIELKEFNMSPFIIEDIHCGISSEGKILLRFLHNKDMYNFHDCIYIGGKDTNILFNKVFKALSIIKIDLTNVSFKYVNFGVIKFQNKIRFQERDYFIDEGDIVKIIKENINNNPQYKNSLRKYEDNIDEKILKEIITFYSLKDNKKRNNIIDYNNIISCDIESYFYVQDAYIKALNISCQSKPLKSHDKMPNYIDSYSYELVELLSAFSQKISSAIDSLEPSIITKYIIDIVKSFNKFYEFVSSEEWYSLEHETYNMKISKATAIVLKNAMSLIGVQTIDEM